jgi:hypothetical protein
MYSDSLRDVRSGFDSGYWPEIFFYTTASRLVLGPTKSPFQWVPGAAPSEVKRLRREADHSSSSAKVKNDGALPPFLLTYLWCDA